MLGIAPAVFPRTELAVQRTLIAALLTTLCLFAGSTAHALSCRGRIVDVGDPAARVRALCGEPASISERVIERSRAVVGRGPGGTLIRDAVSVSVVVQEWVYDFGPQRFMQELTFEDGELRVIRALGYGTAEGHAVRTGRRSLRSPRFLDPAALRRRTLA